MQDDNDKRGICRNCGEFNLLDRTYCERCGAPWGRPSFGVNRILSLIVLSGIALFAGAAGTCSMVCIVAFLVSPFQGDKDLLIISIPLLLIATAIVIPCVRMLYRVWKRK